MNTLPIVHGTFTIERDFRASPGRVFSAFCDIETKARWFIGPPDSWTLIERSLDFRVGGTEVLHGAFSGKKTLFVCRYHDIVPNRRIVYAYDMHHGDRHLSVSLASVELAALTGGGTRMKFTEQAAFFDGEDGTASRERGTAAHFDRLPAILQDPRDIVSSRVFDAPRDRVAEAFRDPEQLARVWGPQGFSNTFHAFDFRRGGTWRFTMHGPDGTDYPSSMEFLDVALPARLVLRRPDDGHGFVLSMTFVELGERTYLTWRMRFDDAAEAERVRSVVVPANEQNFDRLAAHLASCD